MKYLLITIIFTFCGTLAKAEIVLPALVSDHMVIQQGIKVRVWGKASPDEKVIVSVLKQVKSTKTGSDGKWEIFLDPMKAGGPVEMKIQGTNTILIKDVLIGEVWIGSGQSNMEWSVAQSDNAETEIQNSGNNQIRLFRVGHKFSKELQDDVSGEWKICEPEVVGGFSGGLYFFGRDLFKAKKLPVGLIQSCWSATPGEPWLSIEAIKNCPELDYALKNWDAGLVKYQESLGKYQEKVEKWRSDSVSGNSSKPQIPIAPVAKNEPAVLYNGMIAPLTKYAIRGVLWYQGEQNAYEKTAYPYRYLLKALIIDWRKTWGQGDFPFLIAQLSILNKHPYWPVLRESQAEAAKLPNAALITTIDIGDSTNAHFKNKQELGRRFLLAARKIAYHENVEYSGPVFKEATVRGKDLVISFEHAKGMQIKGDAVLKGFFLKTGDEKFHPVNARIEGEKVVIPLDNLTHPVSVQYAFQDVPVFNLINGEGLPAVPFRTELK